jgi:hypothetical protein
VSAKPAYPLKISPALKRAASRLAKEERVSLDYWINMAIAQKIGSAETAAYYRRLLGKPQDGDLRAVLDQVPDNPPTQGDELPSDLAAEFGRA